MLSILAANNAALHNFNFTLVLDHAGRGDQLNCMRKYIYCTFKLFLQHSFSGSSPISAMFSVPTKFSRKKQNYRHKTPLFSKPNILKITTCVFWLDWPWVNVLIITHQHMHTYRKYVKIRIINALHIDVSDLQEITHQKRRKSNIFHSY